jgi:ABC-type enterobactin transport system permease subunit
MGFGMLVISGMTSIYQWASLWVIFWLAGLGIFQAKEKTCVVLAARGMRNLDLGNEMIEDSGIRRLLRASAQRVHVAAMLASLALTAFAFVLLKGPS